MPKEDAQPDESTTAISIVPRLSVPKRRGAADIHPQAKRRRFLEHKTNATFIVYIKKQSSFQKDLDSQVVFKTFSTYGKIVNYDAINPSCYRITWSQRSDAVKARSHLNNRGTKNCTFDIVWESYDRVCREESGPALHEDNSRYIKPQNQREKSNAVSKTMKKLQTTNAKQVDMNGGDLASLVLTARKIPKNQKPYDYWDIDFPPEFLTSRYLRKFYAAQVSQEISRQTSRQVTTNYRYLPRSVRFEVRRPPHQPSGKLTRLQSTTIEKSTEKATDQQVTNILRLSPYDPSNSDNEDNSTEEVDELAADIVVKIEDQNDRAGSVLSMSISFDGVEDSKPNMQDLITQKATRRSAPVIFRRFDSDITSSFCSQFISDFFNLMSGNRSPLIDFYSPTATFSYTIDPSVREQFPPQVRLRIGKKITSHYAIVNALRAFPSSDTECALVDGVMIETPNERKFMLHIQGNQCVFPIEDGIQHSFQRTYILSQSDGPTSYSILLDLLHLHRGRRFPDETWMIDINTNMTESERIIDDRDRSPTYSPQLAETVSPSPSVPFDSMDWSLHVSNPSSTDSDSDSNCDSSFTDLISEIPKPEVLSEFSGNTEETSIISSAKIATSQAPYKKSHRHDSSKQGFAVVDHVSLAEELGLSFESKGVSKRRNNGVDIDMSYLGPLNDPVVTNIVELNAKSRPDKMRWMWRCDPSLDDYVGMSTHGQFLEWSSDGTLKYRLQSSMPHEKLRAFCGDFCPNSNRNQAFIMGFQRSPVEVWTADLLQVYQKIRGRWRRTSFDAGPHNMKVKSEGISSVAFIPDTKLQRLTVAVGSHRHAPGKSKARTHRRSILRYDLDEMEVNVTEERWEGELHTSDITSLLWDPTYHLLSGSMDTKLLRLDPFAMKSQFLYKSNMSISHIQSMDTHSVILSLHGVRDQFEIIDLRNALQPAQTINSTLPTTSTMCSRTKCLTGEAEKPSSFSKGDIHPNGNLFIFPQGCTEPGTRLVRVWDVRKGNRAVAEQKVNLDIIQMTWASDQDKYNLIGLCAGKNIKMLML